MRRDLLIKFEKYLGFFDITFFSLDARRQIHVKILKSLDLVPTEGQIKTNQVPSEIKFRSKIKSHV